MTSETELAFAHPEARSRATAGRPLDRLSLRDHIVEVEIGAFQSERDVTQRLSFNVVVEIAPLPQDLNDDVDRILSYDRLTDAIATELAAERLNLLETLCERIASRILLEPQAERVFVRIEKLDRGPGALGVEIVRSKAPEQQATSVEADGARHPVVAYLSEAALGSGFLGAWLDQLQALPDPVVLCVPPAKYAARADVSDGPRRRMALLSAELTAWRLNHQEPRCTVIASRTELDWALKNHQIGVWAPAKIVLDTPEGGTVNAESGWALAEWFSRQIAARELVVFADGAECGKLTSVIPLRLVDLEQRDL